MTENKTPETITFHALQDGLTLPIRATVEDPGRPSATRLNASHVTKRGETYTLDLAQLVAETKDRDGFTPWPVIIGDDEMQIRTWRRVFLAPGHAEDDPGLVAEVEAARQAEEDRLNQRTLIELSRSGQLAKVRAALRAGEVAR